MNQTLAAIVIAGGNNGVISQLFTALIFGICLLLIWFVGKWFIGKLGAPALAATVWTGLFVILLLIVALNFLLGLGGNSFIKF